MTFLLYVEMVGEFADLEMLLIIGDDILGSDESAEGK